jgi:hypothetical protein
MYVIYLGRIHLYIGTVAKGRMVGLIRGSDSVVDPDPDGIRIQDGKNDPQKGKLVCLRNHHM